jgi:hemolysin III
MRLPTEKEEFLNALTHGIGFLLSLVGFSLLFVFQKYQTWEGVLGTALYGVSLATLYFTSTLYHYETRTSRKFFYRKLDHISIYLLIAGTYSPVVLITLEHSLGWTLFWLVWGIALLGTFLKIFYTGKFELFSTLLYLIMGWLIVFDFSALKESVDTAGLALLMGGGAAYTVGVLFYVLDRRIPFGHVIWHLFVLCGSILHYLFIFTSVI